MIYKPNIAADLNIPFFTTELLNELTPYAIESTKRKVFEYIKVGLGLDYVKGPALELIMPFVKEIMIPMRGTGVFCIIDTDTRLEKHTDTYGIMTKILIPLLPLDNDFMQPTPYYESLDSDNIIHMVDQKLHKPVLINTDIYHGGFVVNKYPRCSLQFTFSSSFEEMINFIQEKKLLRTFECTVVE